MINRYSSPYPNYIHQLFVTPSRHLHVLKDGRLKWQDKAIDVKLENLEQSGKEHVVHFILADHNSAAFYAELRTSKSLLSPGEFLRRAWSPKPDFFFQGIPEHLIVPAGILGKYPEVKELLGQLNVGLVPPSSGFYAGVHQVRNWEKDVASTMSFHDYVEKMPCTLESIAPRIAQSLVMANEREINRVGVRMTRRQVWEMPVAGQPPLRLAT